MTQLSVLSPIRLELKMLCPGVIEAAAVSEAMEHVMLHATERCTPPDALTQSWLIDSNLRAYACCSL